MIKEDYKNEKNLRFIKVIACFIIYFIIGVIAFFIFAINRVDALTSQEHNWYVNGQKCITNNLTSLGTISCLNNANGNRSYTLRSNANLNMTTGKKYTFLYKATVTVYPNATNWASNITGYSVTYNRNGTLGNVESCDHTYSSRNYSDKKEYDLVVTCRDVQFSATTSGFVVRVYFTNSVALTGQGMSAKITQVYLEETGTNNADITNAIDNSTSQIINNNNNNTQNIINNNNNNTQVISGDLQDINSSLTDSSVDNPNNALNGMHNYFGSNGVISDLLLLPVRMFQSIVNTIDGTCSDFNLGTLLGHELIMPCINLSSRLGNTLYDVIDVLISGFFILGIRKKFVDIFEHFTSLKTGGNELE